jgi:hypothetical protein
MKASTTRRSQTPIRLVEIAELLGVTKQRVHQIADEEGFPVPVAEDGRGRLWERRQVQAWAKTWRREKPWRSRGTRAVRGGRHLPKGAVGWAMNRRLLAPSCDRLGVFHIRRRA